MINSSLEQAFGKAKQSGACAFIPFMTAGFPDVPTFLEILTALDRNGADIIEVGLPFSDPLADGPVIQRASKQALDNGVTPPLVLDLIARARRTIKSPVVIMSYWNPILKMGPSVFAARAIESGAAGAIIPDLPPEEADPWLEAAGSRGLATIFMIAPTTTPQRRQRILNLGQGFLYYVSLTGVTGSDFTVTEELVREILALKAQARLPVAVGFGVAGPEQARPLSSVADGVIVGSALIRRVAAQKNSAAQVAAAAGFADLLSQALRHREES
ncbi:MAG: tryptophan synthase subunit alpha [Pseudomonadota bacterium]